MKKVEFKYLGSTATSNRGCDKKEKTQVHTQGGGLGKVSGVICNKRVAAKVKRKGLQEDNESNNVVWFRDGGTDQKTEGRVKDVEIVFGCEG